MSWRQSRTGVEEFGDGIMSAVDFNMDISRKSDPKGDRVRIVMSGKFLPYKRYCLLPAASVEGPAVWLAQGGPARRSCPACGGSTIISPSRFAVAGVRVRYRGSKDFGRREKAIMSKAKVSFESSIKDAEDLLGYFDAMEKPPRENSEVLKRAGLVMALTAWETYVEDRVREEVASRLRVVDGSYVGKFVVDRLEEELKRFNTPTSEKTRKLFRDFLDIDITASWTWQNIDSGKARKTLDELVAKRGDAVHRAKSTVPGAPPAPHLVKREELDKCIRFLRSLVEATDSALSAE